MRSNRRFLPGAIVGALAALAFLLAAADPADAARRVALVIGNGAYQNAPPLPNPPNDAAAMKAALEALGFEVHVAIDKTQRETVQELGRFTASLPGAEAAFFFYSGHGIQIGGTNYLLPVDVEATDELSVTYGSVDIADIVKKMEENAGVSIVVLDACRDNPFLAQLAQAAPQTRSAAPSRGLAVIKASGSGAIIAYSAAAGDVASDGDGANSPYTTSLLKRIAEPNVEIGLMFRRVAGDVDEGTAGDQKPEVLIRLTREFYMNPVAADTPTVTVAASAPSAAEAAAPPAPVGNVQTADAGAYAGEEEATPVEGDDAPARGQAVPYADLLARLDLGRPGHIPTPMWTTPAAEKFEAAEPNDTFGSATPVAANADIRFTIAPRGEADWIYFRAESAGVLNFSTAMQPPEIDLALRILNADGADVSGWISSPRPGGVLEGWYDIPAPGAYWLELRDGYNDAESAAPIDLKLAFTPQEDGYEPNNSPREARVLAANGAHRLNILPRGEGDWFLFQLDRPGLLNVRATNVPPDLDIAMRLLNYDQVDISGWISAARPGGDTDASIAVKQPGLYLLEVRDGYNDGRSGAAFTLESKFTPSPDVLEPNETIGAASVISPDSQHALTLFPTGDADWMKLDVDHPGELVVEATEVPETIDLTFRLLNADQTDLTGWITAPRPGGDTLGSVDLPKAGTYYLEVRDSYNDAGAVEPLTFATRFTPSPDQYEPNDSPGLATSMRPSGEVAFNILPRGEVDWFRVEVEEPGELKIAIDEGPETLDLTFRVLNADQQDLTGWVAAYAAGGLTEGLADLPQAGAYFIEVRDGYNDARDIRHATLTTRFTPTELSYEPNDTFGTATPVALAGISPGYILPRGEADWHLLYAPEPGTLGVAIDEVPEELDVVFRILNSDQADLTGWIVPPRPGGVTTGSIALEKAGWYWMEIRDGGNDARSPAPFRISREFAPAP